MRPFNSRFFSWAGGLVLLWEGAVGLWKGLKWLLGWGGSIDFVVERTQDPKWVGAMLNLFVHPPAWVHILVVILAVIVIIWDQRRARREQSSRGGSLRVKMKDGAPVLISTRGVSSITDNGIDDFTINFTNRPLSQLKRFKMEVQHYLVLGAIGAVLICIALIGAFSTIGNPKADAPAKPVGIAQNSVPPVIKTAAYDVPLKLEALDALLRLSLGDDFNQMVTWGAAIQDEWERAKQNRTFSQFRADLKSWRSRVDEWQKNLAQLRQKNAHYEDLNALMEPTFENAFYPPVALFSEQVEALGDNPNVNINGVIGPSAYNFRSAVIKLSEWATSTRKNATSLRQTLSR